MKLAWLSFWVLDRLKHEKGAVERVPEFGCAGLGASQVGYNLSTANAIALGSNAGASGNQANVYQANNMAKGRSQFEEYNGRLNGQNFNALGSYAHCRNALNNIGHKLPLGLKARLGRSCRAFVNAWRAA